jgi:ribonuclease E
MTTTGISTHKMLINAAHADELRVAITKNGRIIDLDIEHPGSNQKKANIYKGKISSIERSLGAVFVDYGCDRHGFLPLKDIARDFFWNQKDLELKDVDINKALKLNQEILVQVEKEERGNKGAALTTYISLAGSYLVLMPTNPKGGGISRRIEGQSREELREIISKLDIPEGMSVIIRTAGVGKNLEELQWDLDLLLKYWDAIYQAAADKTDMIYLIHQESDIVIRSIRDHLRENIDEIVIDDEETFERVRSYLEKINPEIVNKLTHYDNPLPLFSSFQIEQQIEQAVQGEVKLPSGGSIVIDHTEALVTIDINSARATKGSSIEETAFNTNLEAAREIPRQLRIRDIGGLIVIDFIDMLSNSNQRKIEDALREALKFDRARVQTGKISRFGLMEMSRQRLSSSLSKNTQVSCPRCKGRGCIRSIESTSLAIIRSLQEQSIKSGGAQIQVQLPLDVATYLLNEHRAEFNKIQTQENTDILLLPNQHLISPNFEIKISKSDGTGRTPSYKKVKTPKPTHTAKPQNKRNTHEEPAINQYLSNNLYSPRPKNKSSETSLIKRIRDVIFGSSEEPKNTDKKIEPTTNSNRSNNNRRNTNQRNNNQRQNRKTDTNRSSNNNRRKQTTRSRNTDNNVSTPDNKNERAQQQKKSEPRKNTANKSNRSRNNAKNNENKENNNHGTNTAKQTKTSNQAQNNANKKRLPKTENSERAHEKPKTKPAAKPSEQLQLQLQPQDQNDVKPPVKKPVNKTDKVKSSDTRAKQPTAESKKANVTKEKAAQSSKPQSHGTSATDYIARRKKQKNHTMQQVKTEKTKETTESKE